jgi:two-component system cell cycle sensor histidine kinase PleC
VKPAVASSVKPATRPEGSKTAGAEVGPARQSSAQIAATVVIFSGISFLAFLAIFLLYSLHERRDTIEEAGRQDRSLARTLEQHAARSFDVADFLLRLATTSLAPDGQAVDEATARSVLASWSAYAPRSLAIFLVGAEGKPRYTSSTLTPNANLSDRAYFRFHLDPGNRGKFYIGPPILGRGTRQMVIPMSRAVRDAQGKLTAVMVVAIKLAYFDEFFESIDVGRHGVIGLYTTSGEALAVRPPAAAPEADAETTAKCPSVALAAQGQAEGTIKSEICGDDFPRITSFHLVAGYPLVIRVGLARDDVLATWRVDLWRYGAALVGIAILLALFNFILTQQLDERDRDRQALRAAMVEAEAANRAKSDFLANISHELRTPLNAIIGFSELIVSRLSGSPDNQVYADYARHICDSGNHLLELINDLLDLSKAESGRMELEDEIIDLRAAIERSVATIATLAERGRVTLSLELGEPLPLLHADSGKIRQILINLLSNAVKFTPVGGTVTLRAGIRPDGDFAIAVEDTGIGMSAEEIPVALSPFGQIGSALSRRHSGTGLGLPLTKRLVELHGGRLEIESFPGKGTVVTAYFPAARVEPAAPTTISSRA